MVDEGESVSRLLERIAEKKPDLVEFRLDRLHNFETVSTLASGKRFAAIATDRSQREPATSKKLLSLAANAGFEYVDIDLNAPHLHSLIPEVRAQGCGVITSFHDKEATRSEGELSLVLDRLKKLGGDICKVVTSARNRQDNLTVLNFVNNYSKATRLVSFAMGPIGVPSRVLSPLFGGEFTYAALEASAQTAQGQLSIDKLRMVWKDLGIQ